MVPKHARREVAGFQGLRASMSLASLALVLLVLSPCDRSPPVVSAVEKIDKLTLRAMYARANKNTADRDAKFNAASGATKQERLTRKQRNEKAKEEAAKYIELRKQGVDEVSNTEEAAAMRNYHLRKKKTKGLLRKRKVSLSSVLFPGVSPESYTENEVVPIYADLVESRKTQVPYQFYTLPSCLVPTPKPSTEHKQRRKNLGARLQGFKLQASPFEVSVKRDKGCVPLCQVNIDNKKLGWMRKLVEQQYRVHLNLDSLPVLMRSKELNYAVRGYPVGFKASVSNSGLDSGEIYLYNHLKFTITYKEDSREFDDVRITGFDVHPLSVKHELEGDLRDDSVLSTCNAQHAVGVVNDPSNYLPLRASQTGENLRVIFSYEVKWVQSDLPWSDRWDVYLIGSPDDEIHYFAIVNSLMIVLFLTGAVATIMIRTLRKDIAGYNEMRTPEETQKESGWKLLHGDVFRPPPNPMCLSVLVGTGAQIGTAFLATMLCSMLKLLNPMNKGQLLTSVIVLYVLSGSAAGYVSSRIYKFCDAKAWKRNALATACAFPGLLVAMFMVLNIFLAFAGAATAVPFWMILSVFLLWVCVSAPLVFVGSYFGLMANKLEVPVKTNQMVRFVPEVPWYSHFPFDWLIGGILPFGTVCIEFFFIMNAMWLHQIYYVIGFLVVVFLFLAATSAEMAIIMCYLQLCREDPQWWWNSFLNTSFAGLYLFQYSLWFLVSKLELVGLLPVVVYLTYMSMISMAFGLFSGSVGFVSCFWFNKKIYSALKVD